MSVAKWQVTTLGEHLIPRKQKGIPSKFPEVPYLGLEHVESQTGRILSLGSSMDYKSSSPFVESGDVLYGRLRPYLNKVAIAPEQMYVSGEFIVFPESDTLDSKFLKYLLMSPDFLAFTALLDTGDRPRVSWDKIANFKFRLPNLAEQKGIVETLEDQLSRLEKALADLRFASIRSSHLFLAALDQAIEEVGQGSYKPLRECLISLEGKKLVQRGWSPQCLAHPKSNVTNWAVLKTTAVQNMRFEPQHNKELPRTLTPKQHLEVLPGDFLMTTTGPRNRCGVVCHVASTPEKLIFSGKILRFRPDQDQVKPAWLELVLASHKYQKQLDSLKVGSSDSSVSIGNAQVLELLIPVPRLAVQDRLISKVERIKELSERFELEISHETKKFQQLRDALLNKTFAGNLESE